MQQHSPGILALGERMRQHMADTNSQRAGTFVEKNREIWQVLLVTHTAKRGLVGGH
jgi:hypothetical protein